MTIAIAAKGLFPDYQGWRDEGKKGDSRQPLGLPFTGANGEYIQRLMQNHPVSSLYVFFYLLIIWVCLLLQSGAVDVPEEGVGSCPPPVHTAGMC